jgi:phosphoserine phosphatase
MAIELVGFDPDGTLIRGETCVEAIARRIGRSRECAAFEALSMRDTHAVTAARETIAGWYREYTDSDLTVDLSDMVLAPGSEQGTARAGTTGGWSVAPANAWQVPYYAVA